MTPDLSVPDGDLEAVAVAVPLGRRGTGEEVAPAALFLASDMAFFANGHTLVVDDGSSIIPPYNDEDLATFLTDLAQRARFSAGGRA